MPSPVTPAAAALPQIACTLDPARYRRRTRELGELGAQALRARARIPGGQRLTFAAAPGVEARLQAAVAAEAACCAFLTMTLTRRAGDLVLDVTGPAAAQPLIAELFA